MSIVEIHQRLSVTASWFLLALAIWAFVLFLRRRGIDGAWGGAAVLYIGLVLAQMGLGAWLYWGMGLGVAMDRGWLHILYAVIALIILPAGWTYFGNISDERVKSLAMAAVCLFLWGIVARLGQTAF